MAAKCSFCLSGNRGLALAQELWCKKGAPTAELLGAIRLEPPLPVTPPLPPPRPPAAVLERLTGPGDAVGALLQYHHQGFMANRRQQRMGGLAAIELAQALRHLVRAALPPTPRSPAPTASVESARLLAFWLHAEVAHGDHVQPSGTRLVASRTTFYLLQCRPCCLHFP